MYSTWFGDWTGRTARDTLTTYRLQDISKHVDQESEDVMNDPTRRDSTGADAFEKKERGDATDNQVATELAAIGGELIEGSGFEQEEPEKDFL